MEQRDSKVLEIYAVRHGQTEGNLNKITQGQTNTPLTEKGIQQVIN